MDLGTKLSLVSCNWCNSCTHDTLGFVNDSCNEELGQYERDSHVRG
jgi:hypothetical protein